MPYYDNIIIMHLNAANRLVKHTGYGNAAGLLLAHGLLAGGKDSGQENYSSDSETSDTEEYKKSQQLYVKYRTIESTHGHLNTPWYFGAYLW